MKINKFTKLKDGMYKLELNDRVLILHEDLILKYELLITKKITDSLIIELDSENKMYVGYNLALKYLKNKKRSIKEIKNYLEKNGVDNYSCKIIDKLINQGYLNDDDYASSYIKDRINLSNDGPNKIKKFLLDMEIDNDIIDGHLKMFNENLEIERINKIIAKLLIGNKKGDFNFKLKVKNYLFNLGYNDYVISNCLENVKIDDKELREREYQKLYRKYQKKYSGYELENKIKQSLYIKGFR